MIEVWGILSNSLWLLGLAVLLAGLSWAGWVGQTARLRLRAVLGQPPIQRTLNLGLALFCAGLAASSRTWWERVLWGLLAAAWVIWAWLAGWVAKR